MSIPSVITTPRKPSRLRSSPVITPGDSVAGTPGSIAPTLMCAVMTILTPAATAARNGTSSRRSSRPAGAGTVGTVTWLSSSVAPWPGKCFAVAATPLDCCPPTNAATCRATSSGSEPKARTPTTGLSGSTSMSATGAKLTSMPHALRRAPSDAATSAVRATSSTTPSAALPGSSDPARASSRVTSPPSSSMATSRSWRAARSCVVSAATPSSPRSGFTLRPNKTTPPSPSATSSASHVGGEAVPAKPGKRVARAWPRRCAGSWERFMSALDRARDQARRHPVLDQHKEGHYRDREDDRRRHDTAPVGDLVGAGERPQPHRQRHRLGPVHDDQAQGELVPRLHEPEHARRDQSRRQQREHHDEERTRAAAAVDHGRLLQLPRNAGNEPAQHPHGERHDGGHVEQCQAEDVVGQAPSVEHSELGDEQGLGRDHLDHQDGEDEALAAEEAKARDGKRREEGEEHRTHDRQHRDHSTRSDRRDEVGVGKHLAELSERAVKRQEDRVRPAQVGGLQERAVHHPVDREREYRGEGQAHNVGDAPPAATSRRPEATRRRAAHTGRPNSGLACNGPGLGRHSSSSSRN